MAKAINDVVTSLVESVVFLDNRVKELEDMVNKLDIQVLALHQRSHTHAPMRGNFSGQTQHRGDI